MKDGLVPPPPLGLTPGLSSGRTAAAETAAARKPAKLDGAFLARVYRSMLWFGLLLTVLVGSASKQVPPAVSLAAGVALAALLLRTQEVLVGAVMRPKSETAGIDARLLMALTLPLKYIIVIGSLFALDHFQLIKPMYLGIGFFAGQLVIIAKVAGVVLANRMSAGKVTAS